MAVGLEPPRRGRGSTGFINQVFAFLDRCGGGGPPSAGLLALLPFHVRLDGVLLRRRSLPLSHLEQANRRRACKLRKWECTFALAFTVTFVLTVRSRASSEGASACAMT